MSGAQPRITNAFSSRELGVSQSTLNRDKLAEKFFNEVHQQFVPGPRKKLAELTAVDIENDNIEEILGTFANALVNNFIPNGWHKAGGWQQDDPKRLTPDTIIKYVEPVFAILKSKFPGHDHLRGNPEHQTWWITLKTNLKNGLAQNKAKGADKIFDPKCCTTIALDSSCVSRVGIKISPTHTKNLLGFGRLGRLVSAVWLVSAGWCRLVHGWGLSSRGHRLS